MPTPQEFIENWPLYTRADIVDFSPPDAITRMCNNDPCRKETTWSRNSAARYEHGFSFYVVAYTCVLCNKSTLTVFYRRYDHKLKPGVKPLPGHYSISEWQDYAVQKIGQLPPPSVDIPPDLSNRLGSTAQYYKNALVCRSQNYGIGAVAYMRRVVEEKTDELIDVVIELAQTYNADVQTIESLKKAKTQIRYEEKLQVASELVPAALRPGGVNPLGQLYTHLSVGVHGKTDDECIVIFNDLKDDFEFVFRNLHVEAEQRRQFAQRVQSRAGRKT